MVRPYLPLTALRAFEASARHLSFTRAAIELRVTQAAVSHQVKLLEQRLGVSLFRRLPRGLLITDEGLALLPTLSDSFDRIAGMLDNFDAGHVREVLEVGAVGWLLPRLRDFRERHPFVDVRLSTNNWHDTDAEALFEAPLSALCIPEIAETLREPGDLVRQTLLRSYRSDEWPAWFEAAKVTAATIRGPVFDSSLTMVEAALQGEGVALAPPMMFSRQLAAGALQQPFGVTLSTGRYWLTRLKSRNPTSAMRVFRTWVVDAAAGG